MFFAQNAPFFLSVLSPLLTIQEVTFNEINSLRVGGLQVKIGGRSRQKTENRNLKYEIASASGIKSTQAITESASGRLAN